MTQYSKATKKIMHQSSEIAYWVEGDDRKTPLVLLTGFTGTHGDLLEVARLLKDTFFLIIPEFPGWGDSPQGDSLFTVEDYAEVVLHMLTILGIKKTVLVGHCMGATIALEIACQRPDLISHLFLVSLPYQEGTVGQTFFEDMAKMSSRVPRPFRPLFYFWRSRLITIPMSFVVLQTRTFRKKLSLISKTIFNQSHQDEHVLETNWNSLIAYNYRKARYLRVATTLIHGAKDMLVSPKQAEKFSTLLPDAQVILIPDAGHLPPVETPGEVARIIKRIAVKEI